ncbi:hypothetical protein DTO271G3_6962 [Paecilomyces variotii]|nr:hypothetical protein DTO271G3_6962 [Paecilomyces variotii]
MPATRPSSQRSASGRSHHQPLLKDDRRGRQPSLMPTLDGNEVGHAARRTTFRSRTPVYDAKNATRKKYIYASGFLLLSLISFTVQTETASYITNELHWNNPYCMLYITHGSWIVLWPIQLLILRLQKRQLSWEAFWRRHVYLLRTTAQMVESADLHLTQRDYHRSPVPYMLKTTAFVTTALTVAGGSWYLAVNMTTASDLTAIYNCSAFFAYAFSVPLLGDKFRFDKVFSVIVAIIGVLVVAYGDSSPEKGDGAAGQQQNRPLGNIIIGIGSVLYGLYEVLYKRYACPPEGTSAGRSMIFANTFGSLIGAFTLLVLWVPLPILHVLGFEKFSFPTGEVARVLLISVIANATFSGSFLVLISLTSPVLSSVAALLTIIIVGVADWLRTSKTPSAASFIGCILIIIAFLLLSWSTYRELEEERRRRLSDVGVDSDSDDE